MIELPVPKSFVSTKNFLNVPEGAGSCGLSSWPPPETCWLDFRREECSFNDRLHQVKLHCQVYHPDVIFCPDPGCQVVFTKKEAFNLHMNRQHPGNKYYTRGAWDCFTCAVSLQTFASYRQHYHSLHPQAAEYMFSSPLTSIYSCRCGMKFPRETDLSKHSSTTCPARMHPPRFPVMNHLPTDSPPLKPEPTPDLKYLSIETDPLALHQAMWPRDSVEPPSFGRLVASDEIIIGSRLRASDELRQTLGFRMTDELIVNNGQLEASPGALMSPVMAIKGEPMSVLGASNWGRIIPEWTP